MKQTSTRTLIATVATVAALCSQVEAREPGVGSQFPPGLTIGLPIAANPPPGVYFLNRSAYYNADYKDTNGNNLGLNGKIASESMQLLWSTGWTFLGATHKMFVAVPFLDISLNRTTPATGPVGSFRGSGLADPKIQPIDLSWNLGNGFFLGAGYGFYFPLGNYDKTAAVNTSVNFVTHEPSVSFTYLKDGWNASLHVLYDINAENKATSYKSGDQLFINGTLTKNFDGWNIGPVGYYMKQVTGDKNNGGLPSYGGVVFDPQMLLGLGALVSRDVGPFTVTAFYTRETMARNTFQGDKFWLNVGLKLYGDSPRPKTPGIHK